jgi:hypothetical protein
VLADSISVVLTLLEHTVLTSMYLAIRLQTANLDLINLLNVFFQVFEKNKFKPVVNVHSLNDYEDSDGSEQIVSY